MTRTSTTIYYAQPKNGQDGFYFKYHRDTNSFDYESKGKSLVDDMMVGAISSYNNV